MIEAEYFTDKKHRNNPEPKLRSSQRELSEALIQATQVAQRLLRKGASRWAEFCSDLSPSNSADHVHQWQVASAFLNEYLPSGWEVEFDARDPRGGRG